MANLIDLISLENPVFRAYVFWSSLLVLKVLAMAFLTARQRFGKKVFANPEDAKMTDPKLKAKFDDEDVERVRRAHRNDLENCLPFMTAAFFFVLTNPNVFIAVNLIRAAVIARFVHTFSYAILKVHGPRGISWAVCYLITVYMAVRTAIFFF